MFCYGGLTVYFFNRARDVSVNRVSCRELRIASKRTFEFSVSSQGGDKKKKEKNDSREIDFGFMPSAILSREKRNTSQNSNYTLHNISKGNKRTRKSFCL